MEWTITFNEKSQYAQIVTSGIADKDGSLCMAKEISEALRRKKVRRLLIDHRNIREVSGRPFEIYDRPTEFEEIGVIRTIKVAEVVKPEHRRFFNFLETVCVNRGYRFSIFDDQESALAWLLES